MATNPYAIVKPNKGSVFTNVKRPYQPDYDPRLHFGSFQGDNMSTLAVGKGIESFKVDNQGMWLGANRFEDAPFSVSVTGRMKSVSSAVGSGRRVITQDGAVMFINDLDQVVGIFGDEEALLWV